MHPEQMIFTLEVKKKFAPYYEPFTHARVLDCGSLDINGNNRYLFHDCEYTGIDIQFGDNVDFVKPIHEWTAPGGFPYDTIICTEVLEHDINWPASLRNMWRLLKHEGGLFIMTCATGTRGPHSMYREGGLVKGEYYRNLDADDIRRGFSKPLEDLFTEHEFQTGRDGKDLYFYGVKR